MANGYIDEALRAGVPMEAIESFLSRNPGDFHRILPALGGGREALAAAGLSQTQIAQTLGTTAQTIASGGSITLADVYRAQSGGATAPAMMAIAQSTSTKELIDSAVDREMVGGMRTTSGWGDVIGAIGGAVGGTGNWGDVVREVGETLIPRLPMPGPTPPALPPGGGLPAPRPAPSHPPVTINIPGRGPGRISARRAAVIAAAAAALGMTVEQYLQLYPNAARSRRRMNVLNPRALGRALRRATGFERFARRTIRLNVNKKFKKRRRASR